MSETLVDHPLGIRDVTWALRSDWVRLLKRDALSINARYEQARDFEFRAAAIELLLGRMQAEARRTGSHLVVVFLPSPSDLEPPREEFRIAVEKLRGDDAFQYVDLSDDFRVFAGTHGRRALQVSESDAHPGPAAQRLIANALLEPVRRSLRELDQRELDAAKLRAPQ
jgi:hypothetical protein